MTEVAIRTHGLTKRYGKARGVEELDLEVHRGEVFGFLGPNGAGKTTTIRVLLDLIRPTVGRAEVVGLDSRRDSMEIRRRVAYLPGDLSMHDGLTGREMIDYLSRMRGSTEDARRDRLAAHFDLDLDRKISDLSTGNRQKVGLVQAFLHRPEVLILDEPTTGLDPLMQIATYELIEEAKSEGRTVFLSSHVLPEVERIADRVAIIREGRMVEVESVERLKDRAVRVLEVRFGGPPPAEDELVSIAGVLRARRHGDVVQLRIEGSMDPLVKYLARHEVTAIRSHEADLEDIFLDLYRGDGP